MPRSKLLPLKKVLIELGDEDKPLARSTFYEWRAKGQAPRCVKLPNGSLHVKENELERWINEREESVR